MAYDDLDKELGKTIDKFEQTFKERNAGVAKKKAEEDESKKKCKQIIKDFIMPEMKRIEAYLKTKGQHCVIEFDEDGLKLDSRNRLPAIHFTLIRSTKLLYMGGKPRISFMLLPSNKIGFAFSLDSGPVRHNSTDPSYESNSINSELVKNKIVEMIKRSYEFVKALP